MKRNICTILKNFGISLPAFPVFRAAGQKLTLCFLLSAGLNVYGQNARWDAVERFSASSLEPLFEGGRIYPTWIRGNHAFYYPIERNGVRHHYLVDARTGKQRELIADKPAFVEQYARLVGDTLDAARIPLYGIRFEGKDLSRFYLSRAGKRLVYTLSEGKLSEAPGQAEAGRRPAGRDRCHTSDSLFTMLGSGHNLLVRNNLTGSIRQLTDDGREHASYTGTANLDTAANRARGFWVGHSYVYLLHDLSGVGEMTLVRSLTKGRPQAHTYRMPMPGDKSVAQYRLFWYNADCGQTSWLPIDKYPDQEVYTLATRTPSSMYFIRTSRKADRVDLCRVCTKTGTVAELISEEVTPHLNKSLFNCRIIDNGHRILWWSERTGFGQYYLYDGEGRLLRRVTQGDSLVAGRILHVDSIRREIVFAAYGGRKGVNPYYCHYYKASLDKTEQTLLTPDDGNHELVFSDDRQYAVDLYSRMDMMPRMRVFSIARPSRSHFVAEADSSVLRRAGWQPPVLFTVKAADGKTDLHGVMYLPACLDSTKKYPVISNVYPGPQDDQIPRSFTLDDNGNHSLAQLGCVVVCVGGRGSSPLRGRDFHCYGYGNLRDYPLADDKHVIETLARRHPFMDIDRVGIYGHSGGAFQTVAAMLTYPEFYKVGVAASGNHDNNIYIQWWGETFHGPEETKDGTAGRRKFSVRIPTNMELADRLQGRLLLMTGDEDKNVPPSSTYRMADALIRAGKRFDMFLFPGKAHELSSPYYQNLIRYYFLENLLQPSATPRHTDIINHQ